MISLDSGGHLWLVQALFDNKGIFKSILDERNRKDERGLDEERIKTKINFESYLWVYLLSTTQKAIEANGINYSLV